MGGGFGYALGGINWEATFLSDFGGDNIKIVFGLVTVIFIFTVIFTLTSFREIPLDLVQSDNLLRPLTHAAMKKEREIKLVSLEHKALVEKNPNELEEDSEDEDNEDEESTVTLGQYLKSVIIMPASMKILCLTNLFCWMSHLCYCLYFTDFVGEAVFHGDPTAPFDHPDFKRYDEGVRFGCWGMSISAMSCAVYAKIIEKLIQKYKARKVFVGGLLTYSIGIGTLAFWPTKWGVLLFSVTAGVIYATVFTIPFLLVANYHGKGTVSLLNSLKH
jgi:solute carrier family 45 protein 1/2/4